ncbi:endo-beta-1,4-glucanase D 13 [Stagonosporopsis vannaccii]|nr:endo-beta-1,4-glucanase D 13 [Stagonosporopsis vannaccii]
MKLTITLLLALAADAVSAAALKPRHYVFPALGDTANWTSVRTTANYLTREPINNVNSPLIRCYELNPGTGAPSTQDVNAGSSLTFRIAPNIHHPGPLQFYLARVPTGETASTWDGAGKVWFKIYAEPAIISQSPPGYPKYLSWASLGAQSATVAIPPNTPSGEYLLRIEHVALHAATLPDGAQFHVACAQIRVTAGGNGVPGPLVAFPGAYTQNEKALRVNLFNGLLPGETTYTPPGPPVWSG